MEWSNLGAIVGALVAAGAVVLAGGYLTGQFKKGKNESQLELTDLDDRLIKRYKDLFNSFEGRIKELEEKLALHQGEISRLTNENAVMTRVFQGRDEQTIRFQQEGFQAMKKADEIYGMMMMMNQNVERLAMAIEKHFTIIESKTTVVTHP